MTPFFDRQERNVLCGDFTLPIRDELLQSISFFSVWFEPVPETVGLAESATPMRDELLQNVKLFSSLFEPVLRITLSRATLHS